MKGSLFVLVLLGLSVVPMVVAQELTRSFEVATIRQNKSAEPGRGVQRLPGGRVSETGLSVRGLIRFAYQLSSSELIGGPSWIDSDRYDVVAKLPADPKADEPRPNVPDPLPLAMRTLLADRFKLRIHREQRETDVYSLVVVKRGTLGPSLKPSSIDCEAVVEEAARNGQPFPVRPRSSDGSVSCDILVGPGTIRFGGFGMSRLANTLVGRAGRPVIDRTNLSGTWQFVMTFAPERLPGSNGPAPLFDPDSPSFFTALQEQLGLKLESARAPVGVMVIDGIERPTED